MFTVPRYSVASFYTSAALQVWSRYPELFQSVYPTIPPATCALASFWLSQSDPSNNAQGGVCGSGGIRTLAHPTVTFLLLLRIVVERFNLRYLLTGFHCQVCGSGWNRTTAQAKSYDAGCSSLPVFHSLPMSLILVFWK